MANRLAARLIGIGSYLPEKILSNSDLEKMVETSDEWIFSRTGMRERRIAASDEFTSDMGAKAANIALKQANLNAVDIDIIIVATMSPDYISPSTANLIQAKIAATRAAAMDIQAACSGFIYGLSLAKAYIESGMYKNVLLIAAEKMSAFMDYEERSTCVLFGDGAVATVISYAGAGLKIDTVCLGADGQLADLMSIPAGGSRYPASIETIEKKMHYFKMSGNEVFKHAVRRMTMTAKECLRNAHLTESQISWIVPHQANIRIIEAIAKQLDFPENQVYKKTLPKYGNTSASTVGIALDELLKENSVQNGEHFLLVAFGVGLSWGATILTKESE